jgi:hypothetical protein
MIPLVVGAQFGRLTTVREAESRTDKNGKQVRMWTCKCACGKETTASMSHIRRGHTTSCGCVHTEAMARLSRTHGKTRTRAWNAWVAMNERCYRKTATSYPRYGARGITVCAEWRGSFERFLEDMGACPPGLTLERKDGLKGYSKDNCEWATYKRQAQNRKTSVLLTIEGRTQCLTAWAEETGLNYKTLHSAKADGRDVSLIISAALKKGTP